MSPLIYRNDKHHVHCIVFFIFYFHITQANQILLLGDALDTSSKFSSQLTSFPSEPSLKYLAIISTNVPNKDFVVWIVNRYNPIKNTDNVTNSTEGPCVTVREGKERTIRIVW